jgi:hypothetical protein
VKLFRVLSAHKNCFVNSVYMKLLCAFSVNKIVSCTSVKYKKWFHACTSKWVHNIVSCTSLAYQCFTYLVNRKLFLVLIVH